MHPDNQTIQVTAEISKSTMDRLINRSNEIDLVGLIGALTGVTALFWNMLSAFLGRSRIKIELLSRGTFEPGKQKITSVVLKNLGKNTITLGKVAIFVNDELHECRENKLVLDPESYESLEYRNLDDLQITSVVVDGINIRKRVTFQNGKRCKLGLGFRRLLFGTVYSTND